MELALVAALAAAMFAALCFVLSRALSGQQGDDFVDTSIHPLLGVSEVVAAALVLAVDGAVCAVLLLSAASVHRSFGWRVYRPRSGRTRARLRALPGAEWAPSVCLLRHLPCSPQVPPLRHEQVAAPRAPPPARHAGTRIMSRRVASRRDVRVASRRVASRRVAQRSASRRPQPCPGWQTLHLLATQATLKLDLCASLLATVQAISLHSTTSHAIAT